MSMGRCMRLSLSNLTLLGKLPGIYEEGYPNTIPRLIHSFSLWTSFDNSFFSYSSFFLSSAYHLVSTSFLSSLISLLLGSIFNPFSSQFIDSLYFYMIL